MFKGILVLVSLIFLSVNVCGCVPLLVAGGAVAGGAGTATWISGKLVQELDTPFERTIKAAESALDSLNLGITREVIKTRVAQIKAKYSDGKTIWIDIHKISQSASRVAVRVGAVSNKEAARQILDKIKEYLTEGKTTAQEPKPVVFKELK